MDDQTFINDLMSLGFTEYEAKVYLELLGNHPSTGYQLSKRAGIPRSMVYEALGRLAGRGAVLKTGDERATHYRPIPPEVLLNRYEQEQEKRISSLRKHLKTLFLEKKEERLWSIQGEDTIMSYASQMIRKAEEEVLLVLADEHLHRLSTPIEEAYKKGIILGALLTGEGDLEIGEVARHPPLESELQELTGMLVVVVDQEEALIASADVVSSATITNNRHLALIARQFVWMELFAQRIYQQIGPDILPNLRREDQQIFQHFATAGEQ
jgi:Cd2+/Zn2+-exporting ATPase